MPIIFLIYRDFIHPLLGIGLFTAGMGYAWKYFTDRRIQSLQASLQKEISKVNSRLDKQKESFVHVFKAKFDLEIKVYQELWSAMFFLRDAIFQMSPIMRDVPFGETPDNRRAELVELHKVYNEARNNTLVIWVKHQPFYPQDIHDKIFVFMEACRKEGFRVKMGIQQGQSVLLEKKDENFNEIEAAYNKTCDMIRTRLDQISIIDDVKDS